MTRLVFAGIALGSTSLFTAFIAAVLVATELGVTRSWAGTPAAISVLGTAIGSALLSRVMAARGRKAGLLLGWFIGTSGAVFAVVAVEAGSFVGLLVAMTLLGIGHASNQLSRFVAADMHPIPRRATIVGFAVWSGTIGAVLGPSLLSPGETFAEVAGLSHLASGFLIAAVFFAAATACGLAMRPDPSDLAIEETPLGEPVSLREHRRTPRVRTAIVVLMTAQLAMTAIMTMTPLHIREHGHGVTIVGLVMSSHFLGMFAFAPLVGAIAARIGSSRIAIVGLGTLIVAAAAAAASPTDTGVWIGMSLFLLGLGWCMSFVGGSALLTHGLAYAERVRLQGGVDMFVWSTSALASFSAGLLVGAFDYATLALVGGAAVVGPLLFAIVLGRRGAELEEASATAYSSAG